MGFPLKYFFLHNQRKKTIQWFPKLLNHILFVDITEKFIHENKKTKIEKHPKIRNSFFDFLANFKT